jgi:polysaccharide biosynthesis transport protein
MTVDSPECLGRHQTDQALSPATAEVDIDEITLPLSHYLWILRRHAWRLAGFVISAVVATALVSLRMTPLYDSTATLYVERQEAKGVVGQDSQISNSASVDADMLLASQIKLILSDSVVRPIAQKYDLLYQERQVQDRNEMPRAEAAPILLKRLEVTRPPNTLLLQIRYRSPDPELAADVVNGIAASYIEHAYKLRVQSAASLSRFMERQVEELKAKMEASSARLAQFEKELNVINPEEKTSLLSARLLQLNDEYGKAQTDRMRAQAASEATRDGTLEAAEASAQGVPLRALMDRWNEARQKFAEAREHFGANHPELRRIQAALQELEAEVDAARRSTIRRVAVEYEEAYARERMLKTSLGETKAEYDRLNLRSFEYQRAKREADADRKLYEELVRKIREVGINASVQNDALRIADPGRPAWKPVFPKLYLNLLLALVCSLFIGITAAILSDAADSTVRDPDQASRTFNTQVIGLLPAVKNPKALVIRPLSDNQERRPNIFAPRRNAIPAVANRNAAVFDEAIRAVLNSVLLTDFDRRIKCLFITSATVAEGKSTTASHFAMAHAELDRRTLLIDCDLRRPVQHRLHGVPLGFGLSDVLKGEATWRETIRHTGESPFSHLMTAGSPCSRTIGLMGSLLPGMLAEMAQEFDLVVLDGPPMLGFAESLQLASSADGVVVVARAGDTDRKAVAAGLRSLAHLRANVIGLVLNGVRRNQSPHCYYGYDEAYYSQHQAASAK